MEKSTSQDLVGSYLKDLRKHTLLSREQELELAERFAATGDVEAGQRLMTANLRLVVKLAKKYAHSSTELADLIQEGNLGLAQAIKRYDPTRKVKLSTYAMWWIRAYILKSILDGARLVRVGKTENERKLFFNLRRTQERLSAAGIEPTSEVVSSLLGVPVREIEVMAPRLERGELSLDAPLKPDESERTAISSLRASEEDRPDVIVESRELSHVMSERLREFGTTLKDRERTIFERRWMAETPETLNEIGVHYGISRERARQLEKRLMKRLQQFMHASNDAEAAIAA